MSGKRTADGKDRGIMNVGDDKSELGAGMPALRGFLGLCIIEIDGDCVIRRSIGVSEWEE
jgi:hypothetical protein